MSAAANDQIDRIIAKYSNDARFLIPMLQDIQAEHNYLPEDSLKALAERLDIPLSRIYAVATFYKSLSLKPRGRKVMSVCMGTACHVRGSDRVLDQACRKLKIGSGETTKDNAFTLETVNCLGSCALGPLVTINGKYYGKVTPSSLDRIIKSNREEEPE